MELTLVFQVTQLFVFSFHGTNTQDIRQIMFVNECPSDKESWISRLKLVNCDNIINGYKYSCMMTTNNTFVELCLPITSYETKDGCPIIRMTDFGPEIIRAVCEQQAGCPDKTDTYFYPDEMYKYSACISIQNHHTTEEHVESSTHFQKEKTDTRYSKRNNVSTTDRIDTTRYSQSVPRIEVFTTVTKKPSTSPESDILTIVITNPAVISGIVVFLVIGSVLGICVCVMGRHILKSREEAKYMSSVPYNTAGPHQYNDVNLYEETELNETSEAGMIGGSTEIPAFGETGRLNVTSETGEICYSNSERNPYEAEFPYDEIKSVSR